MIADSMPPAAAPRYLGFSFSGIIGSEGPIARRRRAVLKVFEQLNNNSVVNIQSPPFSGKSSLAFLLAQEAISRSMEPFYISLAQHPSLDELFHRWCGFVFGTLQQFGRPSLILLDDCHSIFGLDRPDIQGFWSLVKAHQMMITHPVKLVFLSTQSKAATESSPHVFQTKIGADLLRPSLDDVNEMFDDYDILCGTVQQPPLGPYLRAVLWRYCDGHFGILRLTLFHIYQERMRALKQADREDAAIVAYLLSEEFNVKLRGLRIPYHKKNLQPLQISLLLRGMTGPMSPTIDDELGACDELVNLGLFTCAFDVHRLTSYEFAAPALKHIVRNDLLSAETRPSFPPASLIEFVLDALRLLKVRRFGSFSQLTLPSSLKR